MWTAAACCRFSKAALLPPETPHEQRMSAAGANAKAPRRAIPRKPSTASRLASRKRQQAAAVHVTPSGLRILFSEEPDHSAIHHFANKNRPPWVTRRAVKAWWSGEMDQASSLIFTGRPPCSALLSAAKMTSKDFWDSSKLVRGMGLPASRASKKAWNWLW